jgi:ABC-2 type transport system ATP-binding protein
VDAAAHGRAVTLPADLSRSSTAGTTVPAVEVVGLLKEFRRRSRRGTPGARVRRVAAIDGITFSIRRGETIAILGRNGSGKSTLVRILSTLLLHDGGEARVFGHDVGRDAREVRRLVNRVSVEASFFKKMSPAENLSYAARFYGMTARQTRDEIPRILGRVDFPEGRRHEPMENLSRGMQQKVALARALLTSPVLLLLDEPTTGLDPRSKREVQDFVREIRTEHDATILLCTHDMTEAAALAERVGIIERGRLLRLESPDELTVRYGGGSLEEAFLAATGRTLGTADEEEDSDEDDDREVFG